MARDGFLVENLGRSYPFILQDETGTGKGSGTMPLPESSLADLSILISPLTSFDPTSNVITLSAVDRLGDGSFQFTFSCDANDLVGNNLVFSVPDTSSRFQVFFTGNNLWEGYLTIGDLTDLIASMPISTSLAAGANPPIAEPCVIIHNVASVRRILLANKDRTRHVQPADCGGSSSSSSSGTATRRIISRDYIFTGNVSFIDGFNSSARQTSQSINIEARVGAGAGEPCDDITVYEGEDPPPGKTTLDGGDRCSEIVSSINGLTGRTIRVQSGQGVRVFPGGDNELIIDVDLSGMAVCQPGSSSSSSQTGG